MSKLDYDGATIEVLNWETYNPRTDSKRPTWFRLENSIATGPGFFGLDCEQKWLWIFILSLVSQKNGGKIVWNAAYTHAQTGIKPAKQFETIEIFEKFARLRVSREVTLRDSHVELEVTTEHSPATDGRTDGRTDSARAHPEANPLVEIWNTNCGDLPKVRGMSKTRKSSADARWSENPNAEHWTEVVRRIAGSAYCQGKRNDPNSKFKNWKADFDFLIKPDTQYRVLEGKYDDYQKRSDGPLLTPEMSEAELAAIRQRTLEERKKRLAEMGISPLLGGSNG